LLWWLLTFYIRQKWQLHKNKYDFFAPLHLDRVLPSSIVNVLDYYLT
jgi:hypothetical protein